MIEEIVGIAVANPIMAVGIAVISWLWWWFSRTVAWTKKVIIPVAKVVTGALAIGSTLPENICKNELLCSGKEVEVNGVKCKDVTLYLLKDGVLALQEGKDTIVFLKPARKEALYMMVWRDHQTLFSYRVEEGQDFPDEKITEQFGYRECASRSGKLYLLQAGNHKLSGLVAGDLIEGKKSRGGGYSFPVGVKHVCVAEFDERRKGKKEMLTVGERE